MKYVVSFLAVLTIFVVTEVQGQDGLKEPEIMISVTPKAYCGKRLSRVLARLCKNGMMLKRADMYNSIDYRPEPEREPEFQYEWPWITHHRAASLERGKRQAATECCEKPCTLDELLTYCRN